MNLRFFVKSKTFANFVKIINDKLVNIEVLYSNYVDSLFDKHVKSEERIGNMEVIMFNPVYGSVAERLSFLEQELKSATNQLKSLAKFNVGDRVWVKFSDDRPRTGGTVVGIDGVKLYKISVPASENAGVQGELLDRQESELKARV